MAQQLSYRTERVNELMRRELVLLLKQKAKDPRLKKVVYPSPCIRRRIINKTQCWRVPQVQSLR